MQSAAQEDRASLKELQKSYIKAYETADDQERQEEQLFPPLEVEQIVDHETIKLAKEWGLDSNFQTGKLSNRVKQQMDYCKAKHRTGMLLKDWSRDKYWQRQNEVLQECDDNI